MKPQHLGQPGDVQHLKEEAGEGGGPAHLQVTVGEGPHITAGLDDLVFSVQVGGDVAPY